MNKEEITELIKEEVKLYMSSIQQTLFKQLLSILENETMKHQSDPEYDWEKLAEIENVGSNNNELSLESRYKESMRIKHLRESENASSQDDTNESASSEA